ncbi:MAG: hypothetical protein ABIA12_02980 [Candidatus Aenigmatarchaeota archaeon]
MKTRAIGRRGFTGIEIAMIGAIFGVVLMMTMLPMVITRINIVRTLEIEYGYDNAELALLALLSDGRIYRDIGTYMTGAPDNAASGFTRSAVQAEVESRLAQLVDSGCFRLYYEGGDIASSGCGTKFVASAYMALPGSTKTELVNLAIG